MANSEQFYDIIGSGSKKAEYSEFNPSLTVNLFQVNDSTAFFKKALFPTPGLSIDDGIIFNIGGENNIGRRLHLFKNKVYAVIKDQVYLITGSVVNGEIKLTHAVIGNINTQVGYVGIAHNNTQIMLVDGVDGWIFDVTTSSFSKIVDPNFPTKPSDVVTLANRFITNQGESNISYYSAQGDGTTWFDPGTFGNFFPMGSEPDIVVGYATLNGKLLVFGQDSTESWFPTQGTQAFKQQLPSIEAGCVAPGTIAKAFGVLVWLSKTTNGTGSILATTGGEPKPISDNTLERVIDSYANIEDARAYIYKNEIGHIMYVINFTTANASWMYDFDANAWYKLESGEKNRHLANDYVYYLSRHYVLDYKEPKLYELSTRYYDDAGIAIRRSRIFQLDKFVIELEHYNKTPFVLLGAEANITQAAFYKIVLNKIRFYLKQGTGTAIGNDIEPILFLRVSKDGGISYGNQLQQRIGSIGNRIYDTIFTKIGGLSP